MHYTLIHSFQGYIGTQYTPPRMDTRLMWSISEPFITEDANNLRWGKTSLMHKLNVRPAISSDNVKSTVLLRNHPEPPALMAVPKVRIITPMKLSEKRKGHASDTFNIKQHTVNKWPVNLSFTESTPEGCKWSSNSSTYNAVPFVLYNTWNSDVALCTTDFAELSNQWLDMATLAFSQHRRGEYSLEEVRDYIRRALHHEYPSLFVFGANTSTEALVNMFFQGNVPFSTVEYWCWCGKITPILTQQCCVVVPHSTTPNGTRYNSSLTTLSWYWCLLRSPYANPMCLDAHHITVTWHLHW